MRWLLFGLIDTSLNLTAGQRRAVYQRVRQHLARHWWANLLLAIPGLIPLLMIPYWQHIARHWSVAWRSTFELVFTLAWLSASCFVLRRLWGAYIHRAVRELGYADCCPRCGYDWSRLPPAARACPECGAGREADPPRCSAP